MFIASFATGPWQANCYLIRRDTAPETVVIDPGVDAADVVKGVLDEHGWTLAGVLCTHGHVDHIAEAALLANQSEVPMWLHSADDYMLTTPSAGIGADSVPLMKQLFGADELPAPTRREDLKGVASLEIAGITFQVTHTPGHTPGCVVFTVTDDRGDAEGDIAFVGDLVFAGSIGRTDLPGGDPARMTRSLREVVLSWGDATKLLPGHGEITALGRERTVNPYLQPRFLEVA
ncbi:MAG: MBL fold metallo-hydrolase [Propionibacteriaceae bacterium]|jgi:glyoxylase-like metal-dependent hydrolase (beta-lactamase superfamily II)|nr:MBL fold metallo-hydrolase [Propionibacteriaceae bacterium]